MEEEHVDRVPETHRWFNFGRLNKYEILLLMFGSLGLVILFFLAIFTLSNNNSKEEKVIFDIIILISTSFSLVYLMRGIFEERSYELMVYAISATCILFYIIIDFIQNHKNTSTVSNVNLAVSLCLMPTTAVFAILLGYNYNIRGHLIFRAIEGLERLQEECKNLFVFESVLMLDCQFELSTIVLILAVTVEFGTLQVVVFSVGVSLSIAWHIFGFISMRKELTIGTFLFMFIGLLEPIYIGFIIYTAISSIRNAMSEPILYPVTPVVSITFALCIIALIVRVLLTLMCVTVFKRFGNGLKEKMNLSCCERNQKLSVEMDDDTQPLLNGPVSINDL